MYYKKESDICTILLYIIISLLVAVAVYSFMNWIETDEDRDRHNRYRKYNPIEQEERYDIHNK